MSIMSNLELSASTVRSQSNQIAFRCTLSEEGVPLMQRTMSIDDFITLIKGATRHVGKTKVTSIGMIPEGMVDGYITNDPSTFGAIFRVPAAKHQFVLSSIGERQRKSYYLPMPNLVFAITVRSGQWREMRCLAYRDWKGTDTTLYHYPFGNVDADAKVCMGSITIGRSKDPILSFSDIPRLIEANLCGETNTDYLKGNKVRLAVDLTQHEFCDSIENCDEFPHHLLLQHPIYGTLEKLTTLFYDN